MTNLSHASDLLAVMVAASRSVKPYCACTSFKYGAGSSGDWSKNAQNPPARGKQLNVVFTPYGDSRRSCCRALGFCGERRDRLTGGYHLGNGRRAYSPVLMRFNSPDTLSPFGRGGMNSYAYCSNDPINRVDRNGANWLSISIFATVLAEGVLNIIDGFTATAKLAVQGLQQNSTPPLGQQLQVLAKTYKGLLKVAGSVLVWNEQEAPSTPSSAQSTLVGFAATNFGVGERLLNINQNARHVGAFLVQSPGQIPRVVLETAGVLTGVTPILTMGKEIAQWRRGGRMQPAAVA